VAERNKKDPFDFWYAVNNTEIKVMPSRHIETFGMTDLKYHLVSELMDTANQTRVREGRMQANRPQIITPDAYSRTVLEGFGDEARQYIEWLKDHEREVRILRYGYTLKREVYSEHLVSESVKTVVERVEKEVRDKNDPLSAVILGVDEPWDVCLVKLFWEVIQTSATTNIRELEQRRMFDDDRGVPRGLRHELEGMFLAASRSPGLIPILGRKLQEIGLFAEYEDRFFSLVKASKRKSE
jgi:hypothetical protein